jgi:hypothetical protein
MKATALRLLSCGLLGVAAYAAPGAAQQSVAPRPVHEHPLAPEKNPPGDIPDSQVFIVYRSPQGYSIKVPEGWARRDSAEGTVFSDKYNTIQLTHVQHRAPLDRQGLNATEIPKLKASGKAVQVTRTQTERLPAGNTEVVFFTSNSDLNPVTNKAIRLENVRYYFWRRGELMMLTLSAPYGADNADQWRLMARSFRWQ